MRHTARMPVSPATPATHAASDHKALAVTPMALVRPIVQAYEARKMDPSGALAVAQIEPGSVRIASARISALQMERISGHAMQELDDESLGWSRRRLPWGSYGMLIRSCLSAPTLGVALKRWCRHHGLICDNVSLHLQLQPGTAAIVLAEVEPLGPWREFCMVSLLRNLHGVACWLIDSRMALQRSEFPYVAPPHADVYPLIFPGPIRFAAEPAMEPEAALQARLCFDPSYLELPIQRDENALRQMLQRALPLQVLPYRRDRLLVRQARQALLDRPEVGQNAARLARALGLSMRTLHRQLRQEGTSVQALKDAVREERSRQLLERGDQPIKQIASDIGFRNEKSFIRAFKLWTGNTPAAWRRLRQGAAAA